MANNWAEMEEKYKQDIEALTESAEMATIEKEIAEEKLDSCEKELHECKGKLTELITQIEVIKKEKQSEHSTSISGESATVTVLQLQKVEEQNEILKQALIKVRDISSQDKKQIEDLRFENEELQVKLLDAQDKEHKYTEQIKVLEEQVDVSQNAQEMVENLTQQKGELEDKLKEVIEDLDSMEKLRDLNEQLLESARESEIDLTNQLDKLRVHCTDLSKRKRDLEDYLTDQERTVAKLKDDNRTLSEQVFQMKEQFKQTESMEQHKHQIENAAYKLNFSESRMAEKEAEIARHKKILAQMEDQMNNMSQITKEQSTRLDDLKMQYDTKVSENSDLQRALKKKMEEVSELEIRRDMAEKKLQSVQKDRESKLAEFTRKIETMKGLEIQHEEDMKRLMEDNELIERERRELRDQLNRSNRSLERSMQTAGNLSMVTAQDTSLASLGISFQSSPSVQSSPISQIQHHQQQPQQQAQQATNILTSLGPNFMTQQSDQRQQAELCSLEDRTSPTTVNMAVPAPGAAASSAISNSTRRQLFPGHLDKASSADSSFLFNKVKELSAAFQQATRKNYELELEMAYRDIENKPPPYCGSEGNFSTNTGYSYGSPQISSIYDLDRAKRLRLEMDKLKKEIRSAMINQQLCPNSRQMSRHLREERFNLAKLAMRYHSLESEANNLLSNSSLSLSKSNANATAAARPGLGAMLQSTPVK